MFCIIKNHQNKRSLMFKAVSRIALFVAITLPFLSAASEYKTPTVKIRTDDEKDFTGKTDTLINHLANNNILKLFNSSKIADLLFSDLPSEWADDGNKAGKEIDISSFRQPNLWTEIELGSIEKSMIEHSRRQIYQHIKTLSQEDLLALYKKGIEKNCFLIVKYCYYAAEEKELFKDPKNFNVSVIAAKKQLLKYCCNTSHLYGKQLCGAIIKSSAHKTDNVITYNLQLLLYHPSMLICFKYLDTQVVFQTLSNACENGDSFDLKCFINAITSFSREDLEDLVNEIKKTNTNNKWDKLLKTIKDNATFLQKTYAFPNDLGSTGEMINYYHKASPIITFLLYAKASSQFILEGESVPFWKKCLRLFGWEVLASLNTKSEYFVSKFLYTKEQENSRWKSTGTVYLAGLLSGYVGAYIFKNLPIQKQKITSKTDSTRMIKQ